MEDIHDIRNPYEFPLWASCLMIAVVLALIGFLIFWYIRKKGSTLKPQPLLPKRKPWEIALDALEDLRLKQYPASGIFKLFYSQLSDIVRHYLEDRFAIKAPEMTTEEFLIFAHTSTAISDGQKQFLRDFLNGCDMVKFAKYTPSVNDAQGNFDLAKKLVQETIVVEDASSEMKR